MLALACGGSPASPDDATVVLLSSEPIEIDPRFVLDAQGLRVSRLLFSGLVGIDPATLDVVPVLAERIETDPSGTVVTATLREGLTFSDGSTLDAADVRATFESILDPEVGSRFLETYRRIEDEPAAWAVNSKAVALQNRIWTEALSALPSPDQTSARVVLLPALNEMFDIAASRSAATFQHPPPVVFIMLGVLALIGAVYAGYALAGRKHATWLHALGFPAVLTLVLFVIVDLEFPRLGFIRVDAADRVLLELRQSLSP